MPLEYKVIFKTNTVCKHYVISSPVSGATSGQWLMALFDHTKFLFNSSCAHPLPTWLAPQPNSNAHLHHHSSASDGNMYEVSSLHSSPVFF